MSVMHCDYCNKYVDTDYDVHFEYDCLHLRHIPCDDCLVCDKEIEDYDIEDSDLEVFTRTGMKLWYGINWNYPRIIMVSRHDKELDQIVWASKKIYCPERKTNV